MKIAPIKTNTAYKRENNSKNILSPSSSPITPQRNELSNLYYHPMKYQPVFKGLKFDSLVKNVTDKKFQGAGLYKDGKWLDFSKIGKEFLSQEPLDLNKATDNEISAYWHANALAETNDSTWVRRFNKYNVPAPLAVFRSLVSKKAQLSFEDNLKELHKTNQNKFLDAPLTNKNGDLSFDCTVFDTETTGLNIDGANKNAPLDKIVQIGAIQVKNGKLVEKSAYNKLLNPEMPIPVGASNVHGITDDMVADKPPIGKILKSFVNEYLNDKNGVIVAYNSKFDITILNNSIRDNGTLKEKQAFKVLDPFILMQRIHPYLGARKKLGEQYKFLFCKNMDNAHDAFADVKGTVNVMKYVLYHLSENRKDKSVPLTLREVLVFQNGGKAENIDIPLDHKGCNAKVNFDQSYRQVAVAVDNYFKGYKLTGKMLNEISEVIGADNAEKLKKDKITNALIDLTPEDGHPINPEETKMQPNSGGVENAFYVMNRNFKKVLEFAKLEPYKGKSKEEIIDFITEKSKLYLHEDSIDLWMKNPNPEDIVKGNDLPNMKIIRKVMSEES